MFETGLDYRFVSDMAASEKINGIFAANRAQADNVGGFQLIAPADVVRDCLSFRSSH